MKKIITVGAILITSLTLASCSTDKTIATTSAGDITQNDLYKAMKITEGASVLQQLIILDVLNGKFGDKVTDSQVNVEFNDQKAQYGEQFTELLKNSNYTEESYKQAIRMNLLIKAAITENTKFTEEDYKTAWESFVPKLTVQHILVEDEATAKDLIVKINAGEDFDTLAKENSIDTESKEDGGKLPEFDHNTAYDPSFIEAAAKLKDGEVTQEPVNGTNGYHIIKMIKNPGKGKMEDHKKELEEIMIKSRLADESYVQSILSQIMQDANIIIKDTDLKGAMDVFLKKDDSSKESSNESK